MPLFPFAPGSLSTACLVTGASRGFGRAITLALVDQARRSDVCGNTTLHLILCGATVSTDLAETRRLVHAAADAPSINDDSASSTLPSPYASPRQTPVKVTSALLGYKFTADTSPDGCRQRAADNAALAAALAQPAWRHARAHALFNNAGVMGALGAGAALGFDAYLAALAVGGAGCGAAASAFLGATAPPAAGPRWLVHTSSLAAREGVPRWAPYCAAKAAGDAVHRAIAAEAAEEEAAAGARRTRVLNYAPGPMRTDMAAEAEAGGAMFPVERWVGVDESAQRLMGLLDADEFDCGGKRPAPHVDFFDGHPFGE